MPEEKNFLRDLGWPEWTGMAIALIVIAAVVEILFPAVGVFVANTATAAWVQALGIIVALIVALHMAAAERVQRRRERKDELLDAMVSMASDVARAALELRLRIVALRNADAGAPNRVPYFAEEIILKDLLDRLAYMARGEAPEIQKNLISEIRRLLAEVLAYVMACTRAQPETIAPDWNAWHQRADDLYTQAGMIRRVEAVIDTQLGA